MDKKNIRTGKQFISKGFINNINVLKKDSKGGYKKVISNHNYLYSGDIIEILGTDEHNIRFLSSNICYEISRGRFETLINANLLVGVANE